MTLLKTVAITSLKELARRRAALLFVFVLPSCSSWPPIDIPWQALRFLALGVGWAIATLALFSHVGARGLDRGLAVIGASPTALFFGRQLAIITTGLAMAAVYFVLVAATQNVPRLPAVALLLVTTVLISAPLGAVVSLVVPRELEGALALLSIMALQLLVDPADAATKLLPLWSTREAFRVRDRTRGRRVAVSRAHALRDHARGVRADRVGGQHCAPEAGPAGSARRRLTGRCRRFRGSR